MNNTRARVNLNNVKLQVQQLLLHVCKPVQFQSRDNMTSATKLFCGLVSATTFLVYVASAVELGNWM